MVDNLQQLTTSAFSRFMKMGSMVGRVGFSMFAERTANLFLSKDSRERRNLEFWMKNGERILDTLGNLKGGAMKIGQMLSLQEGILPPELLEIIRLLQKKAPSLSFGLMKGVIEADLPGYKNIFHTIEEIPYASASIGQVHKGTLKDGRVVAIKIQYPEIDRIIQSDLKNLKVLFKILLSNFLKMDLEKIWEEVSHQLVDELDYQKELKNQKEFIDYFQKYDIIKIPQPIEYASSKRVFTSEFLTGLDVHDIKEQKITQELKNLWGENLFRLFLIQLLDFKMIHSDPNMGNYSFLDDGKVILYDFGSVKRIPVDLGNSLRKLLLSIKKKDFNSIPTHLKEIGIYRSNGNKISMETVSYVLDVFRPIFANDNYRFEQGKNIIQKIADLKRANITESMDLMFPADIIFID